MNHRFKTQAQAEDVIMWHRYCIEVLEKPEASSEELQSMLDELNSRWPVNMFSQPYILVFDPFECPAYIREKRRPSAEERNMRDELITQRWLDNL